MINKGYEYKRLCVLDFKKSLDEYLVSDYIKQKANFIGYMMYDQMKIFYSMKSKEIPTQHYAFVCIDQNKLIGFQYFYLNENNLFAELFGVAVEKEYRQQGIARSLINQSIDYLINKNVKTIKTSLTKTEGENQVYLIDFFEKEIVEKYSNIDFEILYDGRIN